MKMNKLTIILAVSYVWASMGLYISRMFEWMFSIVLKVPSKYLPASTYELINSEGKYVEISRVTALPYNIDLTNNLKLFLKFYAMTAEDGFMEQAGFEMKRAANLLGCTAMFITYILQDATVDESFTTVKSFLVTLTNEGTTKTQENITTVLPFSHVHFDD